LGKLLGGSAGAQDVAAAEAIMRAEGIVKPEQFADFYVPGLQK
jgi:hypothetical protein